MGVARKAEVALAGRRLRVRCWGCWRWRGRGAGRRRSAWEKRRSPATEAFGFEAIDNANLGDKEDNIKQIANLKTKKLGMESDGIKVKAEYDTTELRIKKLTKEIKAQTMRVQKMEGKKAQKATKTKAQKRKKTSARKRKTR